MTKKTLTTLTALLIAIAIPGASPGATAGPLDVIIGAGGGEESCKCCGAGRCASCPSGEDGCVCDFDWQGYPRCAAGGELLQ